MTERMPPRNDAAEKAVLGGVLRWDAALPDVAAVLTPEDFYQHAHQLCFAAMLRVAGAGVPVDLVTVADDLHRHGHTADVPYAYLAELWDATATGANAHHHAGLVKEVALRRHLIHAGAKIQADAYDGSGPASEQLEAAERSIFALANCGGAGEALPVAGGVEESLAQAEAAERGEHRKGTVPTGLLDLDGVLGGGLHASEFTIIAARTSVGKSALGVNLLRHACVERGEPALLASLEMRRAELAGRLLCCQARVNGRNYAQGLLSPDEWGRLAVARHAVNKAPLFIDDAPAQRMHRVASAARKLKLRGGLALVVVDYLQLVEPENNREPRERQVASISRRLKTLARELDVPVLAMAQLNRGPEERQGQRPRLADLRESGSQEQDADNVILLHRDDNRPGVTWAIVAKQRNGPTEDVALGWQPTTMRFESLAKEEERY